MNPGRIYQKYAEYKENIFPRLLESPDTLPEDRPLIRELLTKRWNPYVRRHTALTEKAKILKEPILKMHGGWTQKSQTHLKYEHWFGNEHNESLLEAYGLLDKGIQIDQLKPKQCPNCNEPNKIDSKFCSNCKMILSYDAYNEATQEQERQKSDMEELQENVNKIMELIRENPKLANVKPEVLTKKV
jgi:integrase/recombinase XerD